MKETTNQTKLFGILGTPIAHTLSPVMHSYMAEKNSIDMAYLAFDVAPEKLSEAMRGATAMGAKGFNITAPHKIPIMEYIDIISPDAICMNSVNTIVNKNGVWHGYNTDGDGFCHSLLLEGTEIKDKHILLMGAGGSARSVCYKLAQNGAKSISFTARSAEKIHMIGDLVEKYTHTAFFDYFDKTKKYDIVINATPLGMHPYEDENPCTFMEKIHEGMVCCDLIYNPKKTAFLQQTEEKGARIANGLGMLIMQGILAFEHFTDCALDKEKYYHELMDLFHDYRI